MSTMLFQAVLTASWQGSLVILLILALRPFLGVRVPARWRCILWTFVLIRLLVPAFILPPSPASLQNIALVDRPGEQMASAFDAAYGDFLSPDLAGSQTSGSKEAAAAQSEPASRGKFPWRDIPWWQAGAVLWAAGFFLLASWILGASHRLRLRIHRDARPVSAEIAAIWNRCGERFSLSRSPRLLAASWMTSPVLIGIIRPIVLIPEKESSSLSSRDWEHIFMHELAHYARRDHWTHAIQLLALCVHWFNPMIWLGFRFLRADRELAADESAMNHLERESAMGYGDTLLKVLTGNSTRRIQPAAIGIAEDAIQLKQRFRRIAAFGQAGAIESVVGFVLIVVVATVVLGRESNAPATALPKKTAREIPENAGNLAEVLVPAERGRIVDRKGRALAENRASFDLAIYLPGEPLPDSGLLAFVRRQIVAAEKSLPGISITLSDESIREHFRDRRRLPLVLARDLNPEQRKAFVKLEGTEMTLLSVPLRKYPNGPTAAHILGYVGRTADRVEGTMQAEGFTAGREGLERTFDEVLAGTPGLQMYRFDEQGKQEASEMKNAPVSGGTVVTTLDLDLQKLCEQALQQGASRGAAVVTDCHTGEILALASWPTFDPNRFIPAIGAEEWKTLSGNPDAPLIARAYRSAYLPGSVFKIFTGIAAIESGAVEIGEKIPNPPFLEIAGKRFRDWEAVDQGKLTFLEALERNTNTWFFQAAIRTGAKPILDWALKFGFSAKTGIPLPAESPGVIPTDEVMAQNFQQKWDERSHGWLANFAIGQGITQVTPLQMAQAMATLGNGGTFYPARLVSGVQDSNGKSVGEYPLLAPRQLNIRPELIAELKKALVASVPQRQKTLLAGAQGSVKWFKGSNETRTASWLAGFVPADQPRYAVAVLAEFDGDAEQKDAALQISGKILRALFPTDP